MKIKITFKDPDGVYESIREHVADCVAAMPQSKELDLSSIRADMYDQVSDKLSRWIGYGEYLTVEFDTEAGTATVRPR